MRHKIKTSVIVACIAAMMTSPASTAAPITISGTDLGVQRTTIAVDSTGANVVVFWESTQFPKFEHLRFNRSIDGGAQWLEDPYDFPYNVVNGWFSDYLPEIAFDGQTNLHLVWSQRNDKEPPAYANSPDLGDTWSEKIVLAGGTLPRDLGLALIVDKSGTKLGTIVQDHGRTAFAVEAKGSYSEWEIAGELTGSHLADPSTSFLSSAIAHDGHRFALRLRNGRPEVLAFDGAGVEAIPLLEGMEPCTLAAAHALAADSQGNLFAVVGAAGAIYLLRSDNQGMSFDAMREVAPGGSGERSRPVIAIQENDELVVAWQQSDGETSQIYLARSQDRGETFSEPQKLSASRESQTAPDLVTAAKALYFSFTQDGKALFMRLPGSNAKKAAAEAPNRFPHAGFREWTGSKPEGWIAESSENVGIRPGVFVENSAHQCLEVQPKNREAGRAVLTSEPFDVAPNTSYFFSGHYSSDNSPAEIIGEWMDRDDHILGNFTLRLPDTQDDRVHLFKQISSPVRASRIRWSIRTPDLKGRVRFGDFALREGNVRRFAGEFPTRSLPGDAVFPIYGWLAPNEWLRYGPGQAAFYDTEEMHLDYALANFTVGYRPKFGLRYFPLLYTREQADAFPVETEDRSPSLWAYHGKDEPRAGAFPELAEIAGSLRDRGARKPYWVNLLPTYGFDDDDDAGFTSLEVYENYVRSFLDTVPTSLVTYDHYPLIKNGNSFTWRKDWFANLEIVRKAALERTIDWGIIAQVAVWGKKPAPKDNGLRWQVFTSLAYGAKSLGWFTYLTEIPQAKYGWRDAVIEYNGDRTHNYARLRRINTQVIALGATLMKLQSTGVFHSAPLPELTRGFSDSELVRDVTGGQFVIGEFADKDGETYFLIANRNVNQSSKATLRWNAIPSELQEVSPRDGSLVPVADFVPGSEIWSIALESGGGRLFRFVKT